MQKQVWDTTSYQRDTGFVSVYGEGVLDWLRPVAGERILDLGCGDGALTHKIVASGADVLGVDSSPGFIETARAAGLSVQQVDAHDLQFEQEFDGVFSNAALHWMLQPETVVKGVARALKPQGRFVAEFGGFGNVAALTSVMRAVGAEMGGDADLAAPWYFPTFSQYSSLLQAHGFSVVEATTFYRPTPLPTGVRSWLEVMRAPFFDQFGARREEAYARVETALKPALCDVEGQWIADYVRLRFRAQLL